MDYFSLDARALGENAKIPLCKMADSGEVFYEMASARRSTTRTTTRAR